MIIQNPKFDDRRFVSNDTDLKLVRDDRNDWAKTIEDTFRELSPYPIVYDVNTFDVVNFGEFSYTEYLGGVIIKTLSYEINARLFDELQHQECDFDHISKIKEIYRDKYVSDSILDNGADWADLPKKIIFYPGQNLFPIVSQEQLTRLSFEEEDIYVKLHPLTKDDVIGELKFLMGRHRIIQGRFSAFEFLQAADDVYSTTASELISAAVIFDKEIHDITDFMFLSAGNYFAINRILHKEKNKEERKRKLNNIIGSPESGILFPWMDNIEDRITKYYKKAIELREHYKPIAPTNLLFKLTQNRKKSKEKELSTEEVDFRSEKAKQLQEEQNEHEKDTQID